MIGVPPYLWSRQTARARRQALQGMRFMSDEHRAVHHHVVRQLPREGRPLSPEAMAAAVDLPVERVRGILDELAAHLTFICRNPAGRWCGPTP